MLRYYKYITRGGVCQYLFEKYLKKDNIFLQLKRLFVYK